MIPQNMEQGGESMQHFGRVDRIVEVLASLGVMKSVAGSKPLDHRDDHHRLRHGNNNHFIP